MDLVGPALVAAVVSAIVSVVGWFATFYIGLRRDRLLREEKVHDFVPHMARNMVFESLVGQIHILPGDVIAPVIHYERMRETIERFVLDLRDDTFRQSPADRQLLMYSDYLHMLDRLERLARDALAALDLSLNIRDEDRLTPMSASAVAEAPASQREQP